MRAGIGNETMTGTRIDMTSAAARCDALIRVSEALRGYHDRDALFRSLATELRPVVWFSFLGLTLYDEQTHTVQRYVLEGTGEPLPPPHVDAEHSVAHWMVQHQEPLVFPFEDAETRFPQATAYLESQGIQSACALPLTSPRRRLGMLFHGSRERYSYDAEDLAFLSLVANQVALAIENAENYEALQHSLALERDRMRNVEACDELLRALSTVLDIRRVFPQVSQIAATVLPHDLLTFAFLNGREVVVQATSDEWAPLPTRLKVEHVIPDGGGSAMIGDFEEPDACPPVVPRDFWHRVRSAGYRSSLAVHLPARDQMLSLAFWSKRSHAFDDRQLGMARRIADHVALAVSHEQLADLAREAAEAKLRADRLEARVRSLSDELAAKAGRMVGPSDAWQAVLKAAAQVASSDTTVLLVGESGTGKEVVARFIYHASNRANGPFVALNCAALPEQLLESELFGYEGKRACDCGDQSRSEKGARARRFSRGPLLSAAGLRYQAPATAGTTD
jgi:formate hydrogenlyase transcriptional activator